MDRETVIRLADESGFDVIPADQYMEQDHIADSGNLWITDRLERFAAAVEANCVPPGWKLLKDSTYAERSFDEDYRHENGNYCNTCCNCGRTFTGHKRRYTCKVCAAPAPKEES